MSWLAICDQSNRAVNVKPRLRWRYHGRAKLVAAAATAAAITGSNRTAARWSDMTRSPSIPATCSDRAGQRKF